MKKSTIVLLSCAFGLPFALVNVASALTVCHDFTLFKVTRADGNNLSRGALVEQLQRQPNKYRNILSFTSSDAAKLAKAQRYLRTGDVVFLGSANGHSGFMTPQGIEHFIQVPGQVGLQRNPNNLPNG